MLKALIQICVQRRLGAIFVTLVVAAYGVRAYLQTPIEAFPDVTNVQVNVIAQYPGLAPEEIERQVTIPLERVLNGTPGMIEMRTESLFGLSLIFLTFDDDADMFRARTIVAERTATADLPEGVVPKLAPEATPLGEIYQYRLTGDRQSLYELRGLQEWTVARLLKQVPGVADVVSTGGFIKELHVEVDPARLEAFGVTLTDVVSVLEESNLNVGGGYLRAGEQQLTVRGVGYMRSPDDVRNVVLKSERGTPVLVGDVARVVQSHTPRQGSVGYNLERDIVEGFVLLRRGENPSAVLDAVRAKVDEINRRVLPEGAQIVPFYDRTTLVQGTLGTVHTNLAEGFVLIVCVVWLFLRTVRGSLAVAVVIPLSLLSAFIGLSALGLPANLISMGAIDFGILVDGAVVLVENVVHRARERKPGTRRELMALVAQSAHEVGRPTFFALIIIIAAMIPIFSLERVEGRIFRPLALTYSFALLGALLFSLTVVPALLAVLLRPKDVDVAEPRFVEKLRAGYAALLGRLLRVRALSIAAWLAVLASGGLAASRVGTEFLPELDEGDFVIFIEMAPSVSLERAQDVLVEVRRRILEFPEVVDTLSEHGRPEDGTDNEGINMSETFVKLKPREEWRDGWTKERLVEEMRVSLTEIPGVRFNFSQPIKDNVEEAASGVRGKVVLKVFGDDLDQMRATLQRSVESLKNVAGITDLDLYRDTTTPQLRIELDRSALARAGVTVGQVQRVIETALAGSVATELWEGERVVPVRVRLAARERADATSIGEIWVATPEGGRVPLRELASIDYAIGKAGINREANSRYMALKFNVEGRDLGGAIQEAIETVDREVEVPDGHFLSWSGEFENQRRAIERLQIVVPIALAIVFVLLFLAVGSFKSALSIVAIAPFAMTGGLFALLATGVELSVSAAVGFIALLGQVALAGLLVLGEVEARVREGEARIVAVERGAVVKIRAVTMAAVLAMLGLLPMALSTAVGSETQKPFAVVIIGGMITTLLAATTLLPILHSFWRAPPRGGEIDDASEPPAEAAEEARAA